MTNTGAKGMQKNNQGESPLVRFFRHHSETARLLFRGLPYWALLVPFLLGAAVLLIMQTPFAWVTEKDLQEIAAPVVILVAALVSLYVHYCLRVLFTLFLAVLACALFYRELHIIGSSRTLYATIVILAVLCSVKREALREYFSERVISALLFAAMWTYLVTKLLDRNFFTFLPNYYAWSHNVEESLETVAHLMILALGVVTLRLGTLKNGQGSRDTGKRRERRPA